MNAVQIEQKSYEMPPLEGMSVAHFLTVADVERSARYYEKVFDLPACHLIQLSWPNTLIRKKMFLGIHLQTRQSLNEVAKTGIPV